MPCLDLQCCWFNSLCCWLFGASPVVSCAQAQGHQHVPTVGSRRGSSLPSSGPRERRASSAQGFGYGRTNPRRAGAFRFPLVILPGGLADRESCKSRHGPRQLSASFETEGVTASRENRTPRHGERPPWGTLTGSFNSTNFSTLIGIRGFGFHTPSRKSDGSCPRRPQPGNADNRCEHGIPLSRNGGENRSLAR